MKNADILFVVAEGFEQSEIDTPKAIFEDAKLKCCVAAPKSEPVRGWHHNNWGSSIKPDICLSKAKVGHYRALILPGGLISVPALRMNERVIDLVQDFYRAGKLIAAIGHSVGILISANILKSHQATGYAALRADIMNSGAIWFEAPIVVDGQIITAQNSKYSAEFAREVVEHLTLEPA